MICDYNYKEGLFGLLSEAIACLLNLKMVNFFLSQQGGNTKYPCFMCFWDRRAKTEYWTKKVWPFFFSGGG